VSGCFRQREDWDDAFVTDAGLDGDEDRRWRQSQSEQERASTENNGDRILSDRAATGIKPAAVLSMLHRRG
jgi:hypothetical protein